MEQGFDAVSRTWGGVDLVIINAGLAMVMSLEQMDFAAFQRVERVNIEGALLLLRQSARHFRAQGTGGDIILISTKNVFMPGAKFGAYSATKAAAHQLARIASQEMAEMGVRVNMVAPDAVFSHGARRSGLWAEVGPDRMRARGLDEKGLEDILPIAQSFEGCGDRAARFARSAVLRDAANTHHRRHDSRGRRVAGFDAAVREAETRNSNIEMRSPQRFSISSFEFRQPLTTTTDNRPLNVTILLNDAHVPGANSRYWNRPGSEHYRIRRGGEPLGATSS